MGRANATGLKVKKHVLDNESSNAMKERVIRLECMLKLVLLHCHRRNIVEAATNKNHFIAILAGADQLFLLKLRDKLLPQTELALNLLRLPNAASTISAQAHSFGNFYFDRMPLAPMGCAVQIHKEAITREELGRHIPQMGTIWKLPQAITKPR